MEGYPAESRRLGARIERALSSRAILLASLFVGAGLRVAHVLSLRPLPLFDHLVVDSAAYDAWAQRIAAGDWLGTGAFYQDPLYPYFLAVLYGIAGRDLLVVRLVHVALGVATCALAAVIGRRAAGPLAGNLAAFLVAVFKPSIFLEAEIDKTALGVFLLTAAVALALDPRPRSRFAAGAALGLAALTRGNLLLVAPLAAAAFAWPRDGAAALATAGLGARLREWIHAPATRSAAAFLGAFALVLAPVAWRNHHVSGEWIPTTYGLGAVFYTGNNPANDSGGFEHVPFVRSDPAYEEIDFRAAAEARLGRALSAREVSSFWLGEGLRHVRDDPGFAARVTLRKLALLVSDYEVPDAWDMYFLARYSPVLALPLPSMAWLAGLGALGVVLMWRGSTVVRLLAAFVAVYAAAVVVFFVFSRYRLYVVPVLAALGGAGVATIVARARSRSLAGARPAMAAGLLVAAFSVSGIGTPPKREHLYSFVGLANLYQARGDTGSALRLLGEAGSRDARAPEVLCALGRVYLAVRDDQRAADLLRRCVASDPRFPGAWYWLGVAEFRRGDRTAAEQALRRQLAIVPGHQESANWLRLMARR